MHLEQLVERLERLEKAGSSTQLSEYIQLLRDIGNELLASAQQLEDQLAAAAAAGGWQSADGFGERVKMAVVGPGGETKQETDWI